MARNSKIEWTQDTWNPITGCSVASPGCTNCYAMRLAGTRLAHHPSRAGLTRDTKAGPVWTGEVRFNEQWLMQPLKWKRPRMVFVCAHGDLFHESVPDEWIDRVFAVMALAPQHKFQVLTKRARRMRDYMTRPWLREENGVLVDAGDAYVRIQSALCDLLPKAPAAQLNLAAELQEQHGDGFVPRWPLPNVWLGISAEDQRRADERIPDLLATPAAIRFVSAEPLLGPIDLTRLGTLDGLRIAHPDVVSYHDRDIRPNTISGMQIDALNGANSATIFFQTPDHMGGFACRFPRPFPRLDWIIVGGESGPDARPMHRDWARAIRDQCAAAGVSFLFKQWGEHDNDMLRVGKRRAGRLLDGRTHDEFPLTEGV